MYIRCEWHAQKANYYIQIMIIVYNMLKVKSLVATLLRHIHDFVNMLLCSWVCLYDHNHVDLVDFVGYIYVQ